MTTKPSKKRALAWALATLPLQIALIGGWYDLVFVLPLIVFGGIGLVFGITWACLELSGFYDY